MSSFLQQNEKLEEELIELQTQNTQLLECQEEAKRDLLKEQQKYLRLTNILKEVQNITKKETESVLGISEVLKQIFQLTGSYAEPQTAIRKITTNQNKNLNLNANENESSALNKPKQTDRRTQQLALFDCSYDPEEIGNENVDLNAIENEPSALNKPKQTDRRTQQLAPFDCFYDPEEIENENVDLNAIENEPTALSKPKQTDRSSQKLAPLVCSYDPEEIENEKLPEPKLSIPPDLSTILEESEASFRKSINALLISTRSELNLSKSINNSLTDSSTMLNSALSETSKGPMLNSSSMSDRFINNSSLSLNETVKKSEKDLSNVSLNLRASKVTKRSKDLNKVNCYSPTKDINCISDKELSNNFLNLNTSNITKRSKDSKTGNYSPPPKDINCTSGKDLSIDLLNLKTESITPRSKVLQLSVNSENTLNFCSTPNDVNRSRRLLNVANLVQDLEPIQKIDLNLREERIVECQVSNSKTPVVILTDVVKCGDIEMYNRNKRIKMSPKSLETSTDFEISRIRPSRSAKPRNLKEPSLNKKMRRS